MQKLISWPWERLILLSKSTKLRATTPSGMHKLHWKCTKLYALRVCSVEQCNTLDSNTVTIPPEQLHHHGT